MDKMTYFVTFNDKTKPILVTSKSEMSNHMIKSKIDDMGFVSENIDQIIESNKINIFDLDV